MNKQFIKTILLVVMMLSSASLYSMFVPKTRRAIPTKPNPETPKTMNDIQKKLKSLIEKYKYFFNAFLSETDKQNLSL